MREFVDQCHLGASGQEGGQVHLAARQAGDLLDAQQDGLGFGAPMCSRPSPRRRPRLLREADAPDRASRRSCRSRLPSPIDRQRAVPDAQTVAERRRVRVAHAGVPVQHTARGIDHEQIAVERVRQNPICQRSARYDDDPDARTFFRSPLSRPIGGEMTPPFARTASSVRWRMSSLPTAVASSARSNASANAAARRMNG